MIPLLVLLLIGTVTGAKDPCDADGHSYIPNIGFRFINYRLDKTDVLFHDYQLTEGWYYVGNVTMPEVPPDDIFTCGTKFPVWLNGTHPTGNTPKTVTACQADMVKTCSVKYDVKIKRCAGFYVYYLQKTKSSNVGYCFGVGNNGSAPTYIPPKPTVSTSIDERRGIRNRKFTSAVFACDFIDSKTDSLFYVVSWNMNTFRLYMTPFKKSFNDSELRLTEHLFKERGFKMGSDISCSVRAFSSEYGVPGKSSEVSDAFFAGIRVKTTSLTFDVNEKDPSKRSVRLQPTVPIGCKGSLCDVSVVAYVPDNSVPGMCTGLAFDQSSCGVKMHSDKFSDEMRIPVKTNDNGHYATTGSYEIFLKTENTIENEIWSEYTLPPIQIDIIDKTPTNVYEGKRCHAINDPHMKTFDGTWYDNQQEGDYILYRNTKYNTEVQGRYFTCRYVDKKPIKCNCGIAVKAGQDLFEVNVCYGKIFIGYRFCADKTLEVKSIGDWKYKIFFSYGTYVETSVIYNENTMNVQIVPSSHDEGSGVSVGLCGDLDGNWRNDFHYRPGTSGPALNTGTQVTHLKDQPIGFINVWKVKGDFENLFSPSVNKSIFTPWTFKACVCTNGTVNSHLGSSKIENSIPCFPNGVATCMNGKTLGTHTCSVYRGRARRSMNRNPIIPTVYIDSSRIQKRSVGNTNMTKDEAKQYCQNQIGSSTVFSLCSKVPNVNPNTSLDICVTDIMLTGSTEFTQGTKEWMQDACLSELNRNTTLWEKTGNKTSIAEQIVELACPNNCSSKGSCKKGKCICDKGQGGSDCSIHITIGPTISGLLDHGMCDEKDLPCDHAYVFGNIFTDNDNLTCRLEEFVISSDGQKQQLQTHFVNGEFETIVETICPLRTTRRKRSLSQTGSDAFVTGYRMSVSNDGKTYGDGKDLFIYDSTCQFVQNTSNTLRFELKSGFCFIENKCISSGNVNHKDKCLKCDTYSSTNSWSTVGTAECQSLHPVNAESSSKQINEGSSNNLWIIGVVAGVLVCLTVGAVIVVKHSKKRGKRVSDSSLSVRQPPNQGSTNS